MPKENQPQKHQKSIEEYRRDIHALKHKLQNQEDYLLELRQKYADLDIVGDKSYTFGMKIKILQYSLNDILDKISKFSADPAYDYYCLNYSTLALMKSCEIIGITKEMIFRAVDVDSKGKVKSFDFVSFLKDVMRLDSKFVSSIMWVLCPDESQPVTRERYKQYLSCFMILTEQNGEEIQSLDQPILRVIKPIISQKIDPNSLWNQKEINIALFCYALMNSIKFLDVLDCVACYIKCDPLKTGIINASAAVNFLKNKIEDCKNFSEIRLKKN